MSLKVRLSVFNFWETIAFFANSAVFLYLGVSMNIVSIGQNFLLIMLSFVTVLAARVASTYPILGTINRFTKEKYLWSGDISLCLVVCVEHYL
jgi:monovalent cation:H+ antiporter, CPA1 family